MKSLENAYKRRRTLRFIGRNGRNRPIDVFNPHQRSGLNASIQNGKVKSRPSDRDLTREMSLDRMRLKTRRFVTVRSWSGCLDEAVKTGVIKRFKYPPLHLDPMRQMLPPRLNPGRHNSVLRACAFDDLRWSARPRDRSVWCHHVAWNPDRYNASFKSRVWSRSVVRVHAIDARIFCTRSDPTLSIAPRGLQLKTTVWDFSPTRKNVNEIRRVYKARRIKGFEYPSGLRKAENPLLYKVCI